MLRNHGLHVKENHNPHIDKCKKHGPRFLRLKKSLFPGPQKASNTVNLDSRVGLEKPTVGPEKNLADRDGNGRSHALWKVQKPILANSG